MSRFVRMNPKRVVLVIAVVAVTAIALTTWRSIKRRHQEETLEPDNLDEVAMRHLAKLGNGYVVWERFRDDTWQIWTKRLVGGIEKRLVPEEHGRGHFCPKFSPQGGRLSYLSYEANKTAYQSNPGRTGDLWVMNLDRRKERRLIGKARSYGEDRAVTWINDDVLCYINADGETIELDLKSNRSRKIINAHEAAFGYLPSPDLRYATNGLPIFSTIRPDGTLQHRHSYIGCQPYFTSDSKWGFWVSGAGGPISGVRMETGEVRTIIKRDDDRLDRRRNYVYFPMISPCGSLLAFGASSDLHDHFDADYDLFLAHISPRTLDLIGKPVRYTKYPACDRFPDVYREELPLGSQYVEGETKVWFHPRRGGDFDFDFGDGSPPETGRVVSHVYRKPGDYQIRAVSLDNSHHKLHGYVNVAEPLPPAVIRTRRMDEKNLLLVFNEELDVSEAVVRLNNRTGMLVPELLDDNRAIRIVLPASLPKDAALIIEGVRDRAAIPQVMPSTLVPVPLADWPTTTQNMIFLWRDAKAENKLSDESRCLVEPHGLAYRDEHGAMKLRGGWFEAPDAGSRISEAARRGGQFTIEAAITPEPLSDSKDLLPIIALAGSGGDCNLIIGERDGNLCLVIRTQERPAGIEINMRNNASMEPGKVHYLSVGCISGRLQVLLDREDVIAKVNEELKMTNWKPQSLRFGAVEGMKPWRGKIERVAVFDRRLMLNETLEHLGTAESALVARSATPVWQVRAKLVSSTKPPTLRDIQPYKEALVRNLYRLQEQPGGEGKLPEEMVVTQWSWLGGKPMASQSLKAGDVVELKLHRAEAHGEIEALLVKDDLLEGFDAPRFFDAGEWDQPIK